MCRCTGAKELSRELEQLQAENAKLTAERDQAVKARNLAQERSSADALEKQKLRERLTRLADFCRALLAMGAVETPASLIQELERAARLEVVNAAGI